MATPERTGRVRKVRKAKTPTSTTGVVRLVPLEEDVLLPEALDAASPVSCHLAVEVGRCMPPLGGIVMPSEGLVLVAEADQEGAFRLEDVGGLLTRFSEDPTALGESGMHVGSASLFPWEALRAGDELLKLGELAERAVGLRRQTLTSLPGPTDAPEVARGARREESGPSEQNRREDQLRELLADPELRQLAKRLIAETEGTDKGTVPEVGQGAGDFPGLKLPRPLIEPPEPKPPKETTPPRLGHPLIVEFATFWDARGALSRDQIVKRFQALLDQFHSKQTLGTFELNRAATQWVNFISKKLKIMTFKESESVRVRCSSGIPQGYFILCRTSGKGLPLPGTGSKTFPRLTTLSLSGSHPS